MDPEPQLLGCDFSSRPSRRKPIVIALGRASGGRVTLSKLERLESLEAFGAWLAAPGRWIGAFDFPFGLPRALVEELGWPTEWEACMRHYAALGARRHPHAFRGLLRRAGRWAASSRTAPPTGRPAPARR